MGQDKPEGPVSVNKVEREMSEQEPRENKKTSRGEPHLLRLTSRDKELIAHVAVARYLTGEQVRRLVFSGSTLATQPMERDAGKQSSAVVCRRRLKGLCSKGSGPGYLRRLSFRNAENRPVAVFAPTMLGYSVARQLLGRALPQPAEDVTASFLARTVRLNELYLVLAERHRAAQAPFIWIAANATELPWQELNFQTGRMEERRLAPDAIVELPAERTRVFLEDEMGIAALPRRDESAQAWALSRLNRYASFVLQGSHLTFYAQKYPDGWKPSSSFSSIPTSAPQTSVRSSGNGERSTAPLRWSYARSAPGRRQPCSAAAFTWPILIRRSRSSEVS